MAEVKTFDAAMRFCSSTSTAADLASVLPGKPSRLIDRGSRMNGGTARDSRWILQSPLPDTTPIEEHIEHFLRLLESVPDLLDRLPKDFEADIWCTVHTPSEFAGFGLGEELVQRIAAHRLGLVFSVYSDAEEEKPPRRKR